MNIGKFFTGWFWNLLIGAINILAYLGVKSDLVIKYLTDLKSQSVFEILFLCLAIIFFLKAIFIKKKGLDLNEEILIDMAKNRKDEKISLWDYGKYGQSVVPTNETWKEWISGLVKMTEREDLDYYNFGNEFFFYDLGNRRIIEIPTEKQARTEKVGNTIRNGLVLRLMEKSMK